MENRIEEALDLLSRDWDIDPAVRDFVLGKRRDVSDFAIMIIGVVFHIPYLSDDKRYVLWKCYWPDCHNCCNRQGRLPLTSDDLVTISRKLGYGRVAAFVRRETNTATWEEGGPSGNSVTMTMVNLKRREGETEEEDGSHIRCRFLDEKGACGIHPSRPGVCYLYPFSSWVANEGGRPRVHATFQFTGDCPGFYAAGSVDQMREVLEEYSKVIYDYAMGSGRTVREGYGCTSIH